MGITTARKLDDEAPAPAPRDHNKPPLEELIPLEFREQLTAEHPDFLVLVDDRCGAGDRSSEDYQTGEADRAKCVDQDTYERCGKLAKKLRAMEQHVDATHTVVKAPYLQGGRMVDAERNALLGRIKAARDRVQAQMDSYLEAERKKQREAELERQAELQRQEEERRKAAEVLRENGISEDVLPVAPPPPPLAAPAPLAGPVRTDGATISSGIEWRSQVTDYAKAFRKVKDDASVREAIDKAIQRFVKATKGQVAIPGVTITDHARASVR